MSIGRVQGWTLPLFVALLVALPIFVHQIEEDDLVLKNLFLWLACLPLCGLLIRNRRQIPPGSLPLLAGCLLFSALPAASALWSSDPTAALRATAERIPLALLLLTGASLTGKPKLLARTLLVLVPIGAAGAIWILRDPDHALPLGNTNHAGLLCAAFLPLVLSTRWLLPDAGFSIEGNLKHLLRGGECLLRGTTALLLVGALKAAESRGAWLGALAGLAAVGGLGLWRHGRDARRILFVTLLVGFVLVSVPGVRRVFTRKIDPESATASVRLLIWDSTLQLAADHPLLGVGAGGFAPALPPYRHPEEALLSRLGPRPYRHPRVESPHSFPLLILAELGAIGLGLFALLLSGGLLGALRGAPLPGVGGAISILVASLFLKLLAVPAVAALLALSLGILLGGMSGGRSGNLRRDRVLLYATIGLYLTSCPLLPGLIAPSRSRSDQLELDAYSELDVRSQLKANQLDEARRKIEKARKQLETCLAIDPHRAKAWNLLGLAHLSSGNIERAREAFQEAVRINPTLDPAHANLGRLASNRGDWDAGARHFHQVLSLVPESARAALYAACCHEKLGHRPTAHRYLLRAARLDPVQTRSFLDTPGPGSILARLRNDPALLSVLDRRP